LELKKITEGIEQYSFLKIVLLSLLPGILYLILALLITPSILSLGFPSLFVLILTDLIVIVILELLILLFVSKKKVNKYSLKSVVPYTKKIPPLNFLIYAASLIAYGYTMSIVLSPISVILKENLFSWMPEVFLTEAINPTSFSLTILLITAIFAFIIIGVAVPIVEELYFRGFLMSRISRLGKIWAPLTIVILWSIYHFWAPWNILTFIVLYFPVAWFVIYTENIYLSIITHSIANIMLVLAVISSIFA
jgi:membrane protease YdiL (CAAX protease family)